MQFGLDFLFTNSVVGYIEYLSMATIEYCSFCLKQGRKVYLYFFVRFFTKVTISYGETFL